jgi:histidyl-tRNA synthetase
LILNFPETTAKCLELFNKLLQQNKKVEFYPQPDKLKKQFKYADKK